MTSRATWALQRAPALVALTLLIAETVLFLRVGALFEYLSSTPMPALIVILVATASLVLARTWWVLGFATGLLALAPAVLGLWYARFVSHEIPAAQRAFDAAPALCRMSHRTPACAYDVCLPEARYAMAIECGAGPTGPRVFVYGPSFDVEWIISGDGRPHRP